ncbi:MAG: AMP-binding protein, partial [Burkholderiales bacterium]|nr:AMP-binding protein [Burkholderiales bacterium]
MPQKTVFENLVNSSERFPEKPAVVFYGTQVLYRELLKQTEQLANHLKNECLIKKGDRVIIDLQSSPQ